MDILMKTNKEANKQNLNKTQPTSWQEENCMIRKSTCLLDSTSSSPFQGMEMLHCGDL